MQEQNQEFLPTYEPARIAVERARQIVRENNDMIKHLKSESDIEQELLDEDPFFDAENFSYNDSYSFDLYKIKSSNEITDFLKNIFGVH
ncbi:MAG: hypothetical protein K2Q18_10760 [Bdellovibrionales bacterium]|nr:hypothetical protein [Bdellovibrionales bacterium]